MLKLEIFLLCKQFWEETETGGYHKGMQPHDSICPGYHLPQSAMKTLKNVHGKTSAVELFSLRIPQEAVRKIVLTGSEVDPKAKVSPRDLWVAVPKCVVDGAHVCSGKDCSDLFSLEKSGPLTQVRSGKKEPKRQGMGTEAPSRNAIREFTS